MRKDFILLSLFINGLNIAILSRTSVFFNYIQVRIIFIRDKPKNLKQNFMAPPEFSRRF